MQRWEDELGGPWLAQGSRLHRVQNFSDFFPWPSLSWGAGKKGKKRAWTVRERAAITTQVVT